jgi:hypothetical protein
MKRVKYAVAVHIPAGREFVTKKYTAERPDKFRVVLRATGYWLVHLDRLYSTTRKARAALADIHFPAHTKGVLPIEV